MKELPVLPNIKGKQGSLKLKSDMKAPKKASIKK